MVKIACKTYTPRARTQLRLGRQYLEYDDESIDVHLMGSACSLPRNPAIRTDIAADVIEVASKMAPSQEDITEEQMEEMLARTTAAGEGGGQGV